MTGPDGHEAPGCPRRDPAPEGDGGGLSGLEAAKRLRQYGPNAVPEERPRPVRAFLRKLWAPVPWMLELTLVLELALGRSTQAVIIAALLLLNAALSFAQENRARRALSLLRQRLTIQARVLRDVTWRKVAAQDLVPGDLIRIRIGDLVPADLRLIEGRVQIDQSTLTGESTPVERGPGDAAYAGSVVRRGEATAEVVATGRNTSYGKTAELVHAAAAPSQLQAVTFAIVKYLVAMDLLLVAAILVYGPIAGIPLAELVPFALILLVASVPVALPATFTLADAVGSLELSRRGVLVTRLSALQEAAAMDVLCCDKTGTITENRLALAALHAYPPHTDDELMHLAALASEEATQDPIDLAILAAARGRVGPPRPAQRLQFLPFDPATKRSEATILEGDRSLRVVKGAPPVVAALAGDGPDPAAEVEALAARGCRVLAVAAGPEGALRLVGLIALHDPPRADSPALIRSLRDLGIRVLMVTGDGQATARAVAGQVGIGDRARPAEALRGPIDEGTLACDLFAGVLPEDKFRLVRGLQDAGHVVGMTGDGVNDAPALRQAEVGIAVAEATDVAKAAASLILTDPGLTEILAAVESGRRIHNRMLTYTINKIVKTFQIALFLGLGLPLTGAFVTTPRLVLLLVFANDFVTMSLAADRVGFSPRPGRWDVRTLAAGSLVLAAAWLIVSFAVFFAGRDALGLDLPRVQTLVFLMLVFTGQATVYLVRERGPFWGSLPGRWLLLSSLADLAIICLLATRGILMAPIRPGLVAGLFLGVVGAMVLLDPMKVMLFRSLGLR